MEVVEKLKSKHPHFSKHLKTKAETYVTFTKFPKEIRARIKSTNASENLHRNKKLTPVDTSRVRKSFMPKRILE